MTAQGGLLAYTPDNEQQKNDATMFPSSRNPVHLQGCKENDQSLRAEETDHCENLSSISSSYSSTISSAAHTTEALSDWSSQASVNLMDGLPVSASVSCLSSSNNGAFSSDVGQSLVSANGVSNGEDDRVEGACPTNGDEEGLKGSFDLFDRDQGTVQVAVTGTFFEAKTNSLDNSGHGLVRTQGGTNEGNISYPQVVVPDVELTVGRPSGGTDWERQGVRPKQSQHSEERQLPRECLVQFSDILANGVSEQSAENSVFAETSVVEPLHREEDKHKRFGGKRGSSKQRAKERREKEDMEKQKAASWPQTGGTTFSQQLREHYNNQSSLLSSSRTQSDRIVEDIPLLRQGASPDARGTVRARDWEREGAKLK